jgi:hypothetical protein
MGVAKILAAIVLIKGDLSFSPAAESVDQTGSF